MRRPPVAFAYALLALAVSTATAQANGPLPGVELAATVVPGLALSSAAGTGALPHAYAAGTLGMLLGDRFGLRLEAGALALGPSAFSSSWSRYRGFYGVLARVGVFVRMPSPLPLPASDAAGMTLSLATAVHLERYINSDTLFMHPGMDLAISMPVLIIGNGLRLDAGLAVPILLRADSATAGMAVALTLAWAPAAITAETRMDR